MGIKLTQKLGTPSNVAAGGHLVAPLPIGLSYEELYILQTAGSFSVENWSNLKVIANSKPIQEYRTGTELNVYMQYMKRTTAATNSCLIIDFTRRLLKNQAEQELTALGTGKPANMEEFVTTPQGRFRNPNYNPFPVQVLTFEADLASGFSSSGAVTIYAKVSDPKPTGLIRKVRMFTFGPTANPFELPDYPKGDLIDWMVLKDPTGGPITSLLMLRDNYTIFERTRALNSLIQTDDGVRTPVSGYFFIDTTESGFGSHAIVTAGVNDFRLRVNTSATPSGNLDTTVSYIGNLDR